MTRTNTVLVSFSNEELSSIDNAIRVTGHKRAEFIRHNACVAAWRIAGCEEAGKEFDIIDWLFTPEQKAKLKELFMEDGSDGRLRRGKR
jgi:hypothetical protein